MSANPRVHFVISAPRSGSTWLTRALNAHPEVLATENRLFGEFCEIWQNRNGNAAPRITADCYVQGLARHSSWNELGFDSPVEMQQQLLSEWTKCLIGYLADRSGSAVIVDKVTPYLGTSDIVIEQISRHFPDARIIHLVRDGRDVVTSGVFDWLGRIPEMANHPRNDYFVHDQPGTRLDRFFDDASLRTWCQYWTEPQFAVSHGNLNRSRLLRLTYEQMLDDHAACLQQVFEFIGLQPAAEIAAQCAEESSFQQMAGRDAGQAEPLAKFRSGVAGDWGNWFTRADAELFCEHAGDALIEQGYVTDHLWVQECPDRLNLVK